MLIRSFAAGLTVLTLVGSPRSAQAQEPSPDAPPAAAAPVLPVDTAPQAAPSSAPKASSAAPSLASAAPPSAAEMPPPDADASTSASSARYWYGYQTLGLMGASTLVFFMSFAGNGSAGIVTVPLTAGLSTLGPPIVHWAHGNVGKGFISLGLNVGGFALGAVTTAAMACAGTSCATMYVNGEIVYGLLGGGFGLLAANIVDVTVLSYGKRKPARDASVVGWRPSFVAPALAVHKEGVSVGLQGAF